MISKGVMTRLVTGKFISPSKQFSVHEAVTSSLLSRRAGGGVSYAASVRRFFDNIVAKTGEIATFWLAAVSHSLSNSRQNMRLIKNLVGKLFYSSSAE